jgi:ABC-type dipeptide/oligopeptide/nickel transport system ATPase component
MNDDLLLDVRDLRIITGNDDDPPLVKGVSFQLRQGEIVGIVGESGSGKTLTSLAISRLLPRGLGMAAKKLVFNGHDLLGESERDLRQVLGTQMAMVFQDPMSSLNPARRIGKQMVEAVREHGGLSSRQARELAIRSLEDVHITEPARRLKQYPHELSGGMRQRVMIAMGLMSEPSLIVADEPTTALDVTVQAQVMQLLCDLNDRKGSAVLLISHNISLLSEVCDRIIVMYRGRIVEDLSTAKLLSGPEHPYTQALMRAVPDLNMDREQDLETIENSEFDIEAEVQSA